MTSLHPHWQSTEDERPVAVHSKSSSLESSGSLSRVSSAVIGILVIGGISVAVLNGSDFTLGQVASPTPDVTIRITAEGLIPPSIDIRPTQIIRWVNEDEIPHILTSETLPAENNNTLDSGAIFPNGDYFYTVPTGAQNGKHEYISETSDKITGELTILGGTATSSARSVTVTRSSIATIPTPISSSQRVSSAPTLPGVIQPSSAAPTNPAAVIAVNPHTVGTQGQRASVSNTPVTTHTPMQNAETGPVVWVVIAASIATIAFVTRNAFKRV